jgi:nucleoside-diphosphate-sugar epimerase
MTRVLVTGASGFLGTHLVGALAILQDFEVLACSRERPSNLPDNADFLASPDLGSTSDWSEILTGVECVIHAAGLAADLGSSDAMNLANLRNVNVEGTLALAEQAAALEVSRFIFISTAKVHGEISEIGVPFKESDIHAPSGAYSTSKSEAERGLRTIARMTGMELVIVRPPLIYGSGVQGNFKRLSMVVGKGIPVPLGSVDNLRSMAAVENVVDFLVICVSHPSAANETFFVSDGSDMSTPSLLRHLGDAMGKPVRLFRCPVDVLNSLASIFGKRATLDRLTGSFQVDIGKARRLLGWTPPINVKDALQHTVMCLIGRDRQSLYPSQLRE